MIKYLLSCDDGHQFESWFQSASAFDVLARSGHLACTTCGSGSVKKALMAPKISTKDTAAPAAQQVLATPDGEIENALNDLRRKVEANADYVGDNFASEARAIHLGEKPERAIYGETKPRDAKALIDDGVPVAPLPFMPKRKTN